MERILLKKLGEIVRGTQAANIPLGDFFQPEPVTLVDVECSERIAYRVIRYLYKTHSLEEALLSDEPSVRALAKKWSK